jgi:hypothetical protein
VVAKASGALGTNVTVLPLEVTEPDTAGETVKVEPPSELATMASENVALMVTSRATFVALSAGLVDLTVGGEEAGGPEQPARANASGSTIQLRI